MQRPSSVPTSASASPSASSSSAALPPPPRSASPPRCRPPLRYAHLAWAVLVLLTAVAVADRFSLNVWPRDRHAIGAGPAGSDFRPGLKPGPWTVKVYDVLARVSGRYSIIALNLLLFTTMPVSTACLAESSRLARLVDMSDIHRVHARLHKSNGIALVALTLLHVWTILLPPLFSGWDARVVPGSFEFPLSERKPKGIKDISFDTHTVHLQVDDVFRIVEMTVLLAFILPLSLYWLATRWHLGLHVHRTVAVLYFIDIVRRHTHPHSWILNTPVFILWLIDHAIATRWRRTAPQVHRVVLSDDYMLLFWHAPQQLSQTVGPTYYLRLGSSGFLEPKHAFTALQNRSDMPLADGCAWSTCLIVHTFRNKRVPRTGRVDDRSHTQRVAEAMWGIDLFVWGPFYGSVSELIRRDIENGAAITLVGGGAAAAYMLDALQICGDGNGMAVTVLYTCRDAALFNWVVGMVRAVCEKRISIEARAVLAMTGNEGEDVVDHWAREWARSAELGVRIHAGRLDFAEELPLGHTVYFQGSEALLQSVRNGCRKRRCRLVTGRATGRQKNEWGKKLKEMGKRCCSADASIL